MSVKWTFIALLLGSIVAAPNPAEARCCCHRDFWSYSPGEWEFVWVYGRAYSTNRPSRVRYHYPTWKFDQVEGKWRRISQ
jgi:hypothetical protein